MKENNKTALDVYLDVLMYFNNTNRHLKNEYKNKLNNAEVITWEYIEQLNKKIREDMDLIMTNKE